MPDLLICPDCGGIIGATVTSDEGKPCICFGTKKSVAVQARSALNMGPITTQDRAIPLESHAPIELSPVDMLDETAGPSGWNPTTGSPASVENTASALAPAQGGSKICVTCGANVAGKPRFKDSRGYLCLACHQAERAAEKSATKCSDCSRPVAEAGLFDFEGLRICGSCRADRIAGEKHARKFSGVKAATYKEDEKKQIKWMLIVLGVLVLLIALHKLGILG